jgi:hypothetical protein
MKALSVLGTAAMFLVGGGILVHGLPFLHHAVDALVLQWAPAGSSGMFAMLVHTVMPSFLDVLAGVVAGALVLAGVTLAQTVRSKFK